eukprot:2152989-Pyramimonas_sp.AAC.1
MPTTGWGAVLVEDRSDWATSSLGTYYLSFEASVLIRECPRKIAQSLDSRSAAASHLKFREWIVSSLQDSAGKLHTSMKSQGRVDEVRASSFTAMLGIKTCQWQKKWTSNWFSQAEVFALF